MATSEINTPTKRKNLAHRREPYWETLNIGARLGYRKGKGAGSWVAYYERRSETIGDDLSMDYDQAKKEADKWIAREKHDANVAYTLQECIDDYHDHLLLEKTERTAKYSKSRLEHHLTDKLLNTDIRKLTTRKLKGWRNSMVDASADPETKRKQKDSANRTWSLMRAALNIAFYDELIDSDSAWKKVKSFPGVGDQRKLFLTDKQVTRLLDKTEGTFYTLCKAAVLTGARYGELRKAKAKDLDLQRRTLTLVSRKNKEGKPEARDCYLSTDGFEFFENQVKDKLPEAPLLPSPDGKHWQRTEHTRYMQKAVRVAKLPRETVFYSMRHYHISKAVSAGISLLAIAKNCGTSVRMIEKHYAKFIPEDMHTQMDKVKLG